jgi:hypothetical protein
LLSAACTHGTTIIARALSVHALSAFLIASTVGVPFIFRSNPAAFSASLRVVSSALGAGGDAPGPAAAAAAPVAPPPTVTAAMVPLDMSSTMRSASFELGVFDAELTPCIRSVIRIVSLTSETSERERASAGGEQRSDGAASSRQGMHIIERSETNSRIRGASKYASNCDGSGTH